MSVQSTNMFSEAQQLELNRLLKNVKDKTQREVIFNSYARQCGVAVPGTAVEKTTQKDNAETVGTPQKTYSVPIQNLISGMQLPEELHEDFIGFILKQEKMSFTMNGEIVFDSANKDVLNNALKAFANEHPEAFVNTKSQTHVQFDQKETDQEVVNQLVEDGVIQRESDGRYVILNQEKFNEKLNTWDGEPQYEIIGASRPAAVSAELTTVTNKKSGMIDIPANIRDDRDARVKLEADARKGYAEMLAEADVDTLNAKDLYVAERRYNKDIEKKMQELSFYEGKNGDGSKFTQKRDDADLVQYYINNYADNKHQLNALVDGLKNSTDNNDQAVILEVLQDAGVYGVTKSTKFSELSDELKRKGALLGLAKVYGLESGTLLKLMATYEVMSKRSPEQVAKDDEWFVKEQAKEFVKNKQTEQDSKNTTVHFSADGRKNAPDDGRIHTDIGNKGRRLVMTCPKVFSDGEPITEAAYNKIKDKDGYFPVEVNGKTNYYKFSEEKWKNFAAVMCDPRTATDEQMQMLFGDNMPPKLPDMNMTLQEARNMLLSCKLPAIKSETGTRTLESVIGNGKDTADTKEVNALRHMIESAGYSADGNSTYWKRALHSAKKIGIGATVGFLTGGLGSYLAGAVNIAGQTASQWVNYSGMTAPSTTSFTTPQDTIKDKTTFKYIDVNGTEHTQTVTKNIVVGGKTYTVPVDPQSYSGKVEAPAQEYSDSGNNHFKTALNSGILGGISAGLDSLRTMRGIQERGRNTDDVFDFTRYSQDVAYEAENLTLELPLYTKIQKRSGQMTIGADIPTLKAVAGRGPAAYSGLYRYEDGTPVTPNDFAAAYKAKIRELSGNANADFTKGNFFVYPELTVNGRKIVPAEDYEAEYRKIQPKRPSGGANEVGINPQQKRIVRAQGTTTQ